MIYLEIAGRLGNQFFRYAFAKKIQKLTNKKLIIDFKRVYEGGKYEEGWNNSLKLFQTKDYIEKNNCKKEVFYKNATFIQIFLYTYTRIISKILKKNKNLLKKFQLKMQPILNKYNIFFLELGYYKYDLSHLNSTKVIYICGCFECSDYFNDIRDNILEEFKPVKKLTKQNNDLYDRICNSNSICISVRRGDFVTNKNNKKIYDVCDVEYYNKAIKIIKEKVKNPVFFIFSDDVKWAKENIDFDNSPVYSESGNDTLQDKLFLMSNCKHFIISNSTFSWWAQYLGKNKNKIVVSPSRWYNNGIESNLIEEDWIKI